MAFQRLQYHECNFYLTSHFAHRSALLYTSWQQVPMKPPLAWVTGPLAHGCVVQLASETRAWMIQAKPPQAISSHNLSRIHHLNITYLLLHTLINHAVICHTPPPVCCCVSALCTYTAYLFSTFLWSLLQLSLMAQQNILWDGRSKKGTCVKESRREVFSLLRMWSNWVDLDVVAISSFAGCPHPPHPYPGL